MKQEKPVIRQSPTDKMIQSKMTDDNTVQNMFDRNQRHYVWQHNLPSGIGNTRVDSGFLYNPNAAETQTMTTGRGNWWDPRTWGKGDGTLDNRMGLYYNQKQYLDALQSLDKNGFTLEGNGANYTVSPDTVAFLNATSPYYTTPLSNDPAVEASIRNQITGNVGQLYDKQGTWQALRGFNDYNTKIQKDLNAMYQYAMYELKSNDSATRDHGKYLMGVVARGQQVFNLAQPEINKSVQARIQPYKDFFSNNWWWMIPGGLLALGGIGSLFAGRGQEEQPDAQQAGWPFAKGAPAQQNLPPGWTSGIIPETPQTPAMGV